MRCIVDVERSDSDSGSHGDRFGAVVAQVEYSFLLRKGISARTTASS